MSDRRSLSVCVNALSFPRRWVRAPGGSASISSVIPSSVVAIAAVVAAVVSWERHETALLGRARYRNSYYEYIYSAYSRAGRSQH